MSNYVSRNGLAFEVAPWEFGEEYQRFRIGTVTGLWGSNDQAYLILALQNDNPGNGHLEDLFDWFYQSCRRDQKDLIIQEVWNAGLREHLIKKRGFKPKGKEDLIKLYRKIK